MKTYFLSGCTENLGVVPLFLFAAFLFFPIFLSFILLLQLVCIVLDAIILSLFINSFSFIKSRQIFLYALVFIVKGFYPGHIYAKSQKITTVESQEYFLAKGEQIELNINKLENYSVGNPEVISVKFRPDKKNVLVKGKLMGFTDLIIWEKNQKKIYNFYIISKREQLKRIELLKGIKQIGLTAQMNAGIIYAEGQITNISQYKYILKLKEQFPEIIWQVSLKESTRNSIIADIYKTLYKKGIEYIECDQLGLNFYCYYKGKISIERKEYLNNKYLVSFSKTPESIVNNYYIEFKIIQIEHLKSKKTDLGLQEVSASIGDLINFTDFIKEETISISSGDVKASLIANPKGIITKGGNLEVSLGSEMPFSQTSNNGVNTQWKFAGLRVHTTLSEKDQELLLQYNTNFTQPLKDSVSGSKGQGSVYINKNKFIRLFEITFETKGQDKKYVPYMNKVPILKHLFESYMENETHKQIIGFVKIKEMKK